MRKSLLSETLSTTEEPNIAELHSLSEKWIEAMQKGDFEAAWMQTDRIEVPRRAAERKGTFLRASHHLRWDGKSFFGQQVLVCCEHGLGDTIQFIRYCPLLRRIARKVTVNVQPALQELLSGMHGIDCLISGWTKRPDPRYDLAIECMELPYGFRHTITTLPSKVPYLPLKRILERSRSFESLPAGKLNVGLVWAASGWNTRRSIPLRLLEPLAQMSNIRFYSLQQGPEQADICKVTLPISPLAKSTSKIQDSAAAMLALDVVVTVDTMTAHLAGALGRPVFLLLTHSADWRWLRHREDSPWYPSMRILQQPVPEDWHRVVEKLASDLTRLVSRKRSFPRLTSIRA
jgi:hypothetical protein